MVYWMINLNIEKSKEPLSKQYIKLDVTTQIMIIERPDSFKKVLQHRNLSYQN